MPAQQLKAGACQQSTRSVVDDIEAFTGRREVGSLVIVDGIDAEAFGALNRIHVAASRDRRAKRPRELDDFIPTCWWAQTSPASHFTTSLTCSLPTAEGQLTLAGRRLIETVGDVRTERDLGSDAAVLAAYRDRFGIELSEVPAVGGCPGPAAAGP